MRNRTRFPLLSFGIIFALVVCLATPVALAQQATASITGLVTDPSGAPIANARVTAKDADRGTTWPTKTNSEGLYSLPTLPVGRYEVRVESSGFQTALRPAFQLDINQAARVDVQMKVGQVSETVEVSSAAPLLQTETTQVNTVLAAQAIASLPLETRNYNQLALLIPGSVTTSPCAFNTGPTTFNSRRPYINGNRQQANYYILDGMHNNELVTNTLPYPPHVPPIHDIHTH